MSTEPEQKKDIPNWVILFAVVGFLVAMLLTVTGQKPVQKFEGKAAPFFQLLDRNGQVGGFTKPGRVQVIDFWATWCPPCIEQTPAIERLRAAHPEIDVVSVNADDPGPNREADIQGFLSRGPWEFPILLDDGSASRLYTITNLPTLIVVKKDGTVHYADSGKVSYQKLESLVREASLE